MAMHAGQLEVTPEVATALIGEQFPQWRHLAVTPVSSAGTVNALFRIGTELAARFPLLGDDPARTRALLEREATAARELTEVSPVPTPLPVAVGRPGSGYPLPWSVQSWLPGTTAEHEDPGASVRFAEDLADFIAALRSASTGGRRFAGDGRGGDLRDHDEWLAVCFRESERLVDVPSLRKLWADLRTLPRAGADVMSHGDLTPGNVLVDGGRLAGVLDGGGFGPADPALDLVAAWHLLEAGPRLQLRNRLGCGDVEWSRGRAWALQQAMGAIWYYVESNPAMSRMARRTLDRILAAS